MKCTFQSNYVFHLGSETKIRQFQFPFVKFSFLNEIINNAFSYIFTYAYVYYGYF